MEANNDSFVQMIERLAEDLKRIETSGDTSPCLLSSPHPRERLLAETTTTRDRLQATTLSTSTRERLIATVSTPGGEGDTTVDQELENNETDAEKLEKRIRKNLEDHPRRPKLKTTKLKNVTLVPFKPRDGSGASSSTQSISSSPPKSPDVIDLDDLPDFPESPAVTPDEIVETRCKIVVDLTEEDDEERPPTPPPPPSSNVDDDLNSALEVVRRHAEEVTANASTVLSDAVETMRRHAEGLPSVDAALNDALALVRRQESEILRSTGNEETSVDDELPATPFLQRKATEKESATSTADSPAKGITCPVCLDSQNQIMKQGRQLVSTTCGHIFCDQCIKESIASMKKCPTCRKKLNQKQFHPDRKSVV